MSGNTCHQYNKSVRDNQIECARMYEEKGGKEAKKDNKIGK